jgi:hypothetical protein
VKTPGQVAADQINSALNGKNITDAWIHELNGSTDTNPFSSTVKFQISGQFVIVNLGSSVKYYYNLERLIKFEIYSPPGGRLDLFFK